MRVSIIHRTPSTWGGGRPNGIQYVLRAGCAWRLMPHDLPHGQTAYQTFRAWRIDGTWMHIHDQCRDAACTPHGAHPQPSAAAACQALL